MLYNVRMGIEFIRGDSRNPRGHALIYFKDRDDGHIVGSYIVILPITMDMGKYLPPLLASQLGSMMTESLSGSFTSFAAPPMPEFMENLERLQELAEARGDDLLYGGTILASDAGAAIQDTSDAVQAYAALYAQYMTGIVQRTLETGHALPNVSEVQRVVYEMLTETDRLTELAKLVGTLRFALERNDTNLVTETGMSIDILSQLLPEHYQVPKVAAVARDLTEHGATLARLYLERCFSLLAEDYTTVESLDRQISAEDRSPL